MRNYIETYWQSFDIFDGTDPNNPVQTGTVTRVSTDSDEAAAYAATLPTSGPVFFVPQDAGSPVFVLLDKAAMIFALNSQAPFQNSANIQFESPRNPGVLPGWPNNDGNPAGPTYNKHIGDIKHFQTTGSGGRSATIRTLTYLNLLLNTWLLGTTAQGRRLGGTLVPKRWIDTLVATIAKLTAGKITSDEALQIIKDLA